MFEDIQKQIVAIETDLKYSEAELRSANDLYLECLNKISILKENGTVLRGILDKMKYETKVISLKEYRELIFELNFNNNLFSKTFREMEMAKYRTTELREMVEQNKTLLKKLHARLDKQGKIIQHDFRRDKSIDK